jgi:phosphatidylglycerol lysyltransferase
MKRRFRLFVFVRNPYFWRISLAFLFIAFLIYFVKNEHLELFSIRDELERARPLLVIAGILITILYVWMQGLLYVYSFRAINQQLSISSAILIFLKRNFIGVFLPAGTFSSLTFFNKELENQKISPTQGYYGSYLFVVSSLISVAVVAVPALIVLFASKGIRSVEIYAFAALLFFILLLVWAINSMIKKGLLYRMIARFRPDWTVILEELQAQHFNRGWFVKASLVSVGIEVTGIIHLYIAMAALGIEPSWAAALMGYVIMVLLLSVSPVLKGLGAIEISMTYMLTRYGFSTIEAASATLLFRFFEFWLPLFAGIFAFVLRKGGLVVRVLPAIIIFFLGLVNVISAMTPAIPARLRLIETWVSQDVALISNYAVMIFGVILIGLSIYLFIGTRNAWKLAVILTFGSLIGHLIKAIDYEEATFALIAFVSLIITRKSYYVRNDIQYQRKNIANILIAILSIFVYSTIGFYFLHRRHFGIDFSLKESVESFVKIFFLFEPNVLTPRTLFAKGFINSIYLSGSLVILYTLYTVFRPLKNKTEELKVEKQRAMDILGKYGQSALDYFKTYSDKLLFFSESGNSFLAYRTASKYAVVLETPVGPPKEIENIIREFDDFCQDNGLKSFYYRVSEKTLPQFDGLNKKSLKIGQEAVVDLTTFTTSGTSKQSLRNAMNKVEKAGYTLKIYKQPVKEGLLQKLRQVSDEWLADTEKEEVVFTQGYFEPEILRNCTLLTVENEEEKVVAFANLIPDYVPGEATYDLIRKSTNGPNGALDYLMIKMFEYLKTEGYTAVNLGLAPLAGITKPKNLTEQTITFVRDRLKQMSRFKGLYHYKDKFEPKWLDKFLVYDDPFDLIQFPIVLSKVSQLKEPFF